MMGRYRNDFDDEREYQMRNDRFGRERPWNYSRPYSDDFPRDDFDRRDLGAGRYGERARYEYDEPRYQDYPRRYRGDSRAEYETQDVYPQPRSTRGLRSRVRARDIMTRDLAVATRDSSLRDVAHMMKEEDTGVIPVVDYAANGGNGRTTTEERRATGTTHGRGKLVGLITDRDIVVRAVSDSKDCGATRAEEIMSTDIYAARPNDRIVDIVRKMGDKQVRRIPVINEGGSLLGMISMSDVALETEADHELAEALEDISKESSFWGKIFG